MQIYIFEFNINTLLIEQNARLYLFEKEILRPLIFLRNNEH